MFHRRYFVAIHEIKSVLTLDKQSYVGFTILDLSKYIQLSNDKCAILLFPDTDSLVYEIETNYENKNLFDCDYPEESIESIKKLFKT